MPLPTDPDLQVTLESQLVDRLPTGSPGAIFCFGHCFHRHRAVVGLELIIDGRRHRPTAFRMPRRDLYRWLHGAGDTDPEHGLSDPEGRSYRSGFWATLPVCPGAEPGEIILEAAVRLAGGTELRQPLGRIEVTAPEPKPLPVRAADTIAVCLPTYEPDLALLRGQVESIRGQTDRDWICLICDGGSSPERFEQIEALVGDDARFSVWRTPERLDPYSNFERALRLVPDGVELIALSDQDDRWYPDKLATLRETLGSAQLVYSDLRLVTPQGHVLRDSLWRGRRNEYRNLASVLVANTMPGAAMLFRRQVAELALPFPRTPTVQFHDHWLALVALASGEVRYVDRPLYDWVQHSESASRAVPGAPSSRWRAAYFCGYVPREVQAVTLLMRCQHQLTRRKRRALRWLVSSQRSPAAFAWLALRPLRALVGRGETLGQEATLVRGIAWRWLLRPLARSPRLRADAGFPDPPALDQPRLRRWRAGR